MKRGLFLVVAAFTVGGLAALRLPAAEPGLGTAPAPGTAPADAPSADAAGTPGATDGKASWPTRWQATAARAMDRAALVEAGVALPVGADVFAARLYAGPDQPAYTFYEAGGGAFDDSFYPASAVKLLAALGALGFVSSLGFTGEATVDGAYTLRDVYEGAIRDSSNEDYDELLRIAGLDWLNREFLPSLGDASTVIQETYASGDDVGYSPEMVLAEGNRRAEIPARRASGDYGCAGHNCTNLATLADAVRRVVLDAELPAPERLALAPDDITALKGALAGAEGFIEPGVREALGDDALIFTKPGWVSGLDCVESALVSQPASGARYLLAVSVPDTGSCDVLSDLAYEVLRALEARPPAVAVRADGTTVRAADRGQPSRG